MFENVLFEIFQMKDFVVASLNRGDIVVGLSTLLASMKFCFVLGHILLCLTSL